MSLFDIDKWQEIYSALKQNKLRTFFTAFGVAWGIFMLVIMLGSGRGLQNATRQGMGDMATNSFFMWTSRTTMPYKGFPRGRFYRFNNGDTKAMVENIKEIEYIAPRWSGMFRRGNGDNNVVRGERTASFQLNGDYPEFFKIDPVNIHQGRFINELDIKECRKVAVIGTRVKEEMFAPDEDPIGEYLRINGAYYKVVGLFSSKRTDQRSQDDNQSIFVPFTTLQKAFNLGDRVGFYSITSKEGTPATVLEENVKALLRERHAIHPEDARAIGSFNVENQFNKMRNLFAGINGLIWIVGVGTLLAGVIGVSNIMLIVVKERTKEIGIKRAVGASPANIISQIITESVFLTTFAGFFGLAAGVGVLELVNYGLTMSGGNNDMFNNPSVDFNKAITALILLVISGVFAGMIPAKRAVSIRPVQALHDEN
jgi:putative ABC transport system permease protein